MILKSLRAAALGATILVVGGASVAIAQAPPAPKHEGMGERHEHGDPAAMMQRHAQHLRDALQLTPAQEPALQALLAAMKPPEGAREHMMRGHEEMEHLTTPQRLERMRTMMTEHMAAFDQHAQAVTRFYAQLTPAQQKAFDAMPPMMMHHGMHGMHGMEGHGMKDHEMGGHPPMPPRP